MRAQQGKKLLIANAQGFWGDSLLGPLRLVEEGPVDYLTFDYLAEITMSIMQKQKMRDANSGYATDFVKLIGRIVGRCKQKNIKIIANAGGVNPRACLRAIKNTIAAAGVTGIRVGIVEGDDIVDRIDELRASGEAFTNLETHAGVEGIADRITSANVYIGAGAIVEALRQGADIVVTGRASDPSLVLAPLMYEFDWSPDDYNKMAAGTVMGHVIECGTQCTGGNFTDWQQVPDMARIGFPVVEASADGSFVVTKHADTGGLVSVETVTSQLLYELGDPKNYLSPDCIADFTTIQIAHDGENRVRLSGIRGREASSTFKVSMSYSNGYKVLSSLCISGPDAVKKAQRLAQMVFARVQMHGFEIAERDRFLELFGNNLLYRGIVPQTDQPHEVLMRLGAKSHDPKALQILAAEIAPLITSGPPGITGFASGRARPTEIVGYWPTLIDKSRVNTRVLVEGV